MRMKRRSILARLVGSVVKRFCAAQLVCLLALGVSAPGAAEAPPAQTALSSGTASDIASGTAFGIVSGIVSGTVSGTVSGIRANRPAQVRSVATDQGYMVPYIEQIPGTTISFEMIPLPGGSFLLGSPAAEEGRMGDEGPQVRVQVSPCWIGKCEICWEEYGAFMELYYAFKSLDTLRSELAHAGKLAGEAQSLESLQSFLRGESPEVDGVTCPTPLYDPDTTYAAGDAPDQPAVTMTQFAAKQYTKWLSGITGKQYRLPTEAEWEYAARAGTTTPFSFGDVNAFDDHAWHAGNADEQTHRIASKKANGWGLHDMHGNVAEWVLDEYDDAHYQRIAVTDNLPTIERKVEIVSARDAVRWPTRLYPRVIRGGCWFDDPAKCRSAARHKSEDPEWNMSDPNLPKSPWWYTEKESTGVGFRSLRPLEAMDQSQQKRVWEADIEQIRMDVADRLREGRGTQSAADVRLPGAIQEINAAGLVE